MHVAASAITALALAGMFTLAYAQPYADTVTFLRIGDAGQAVEAVRNGTLDIYYQSVPYHLLNDTEGLVVHEVPAGGTLGLLLNPADGERFNPFQLSTIRFAVNLMVDRDYVVDELLGGYGASIVSPFAPHDPDYIRTLEQTESFAIVHDPELAHAIVHKAMVNAGGVMEDGIWAVDGEPVSITVFIRNDDPIRNDIGSMLASTLEDTGFVVERTYGNLLDAYDRVYGSDPGMLEWHVYTEGWGGSFSRYDDVSLAIFYAPWTANMPGHTNPEFWNYEHDELDRITQAIYNGEYDDADHRTEMVQNAVFLGMQQSVRLFVASQADTYVVNEQAIGVINRVGAGITHGLTLTNMQVPSDHVRVGVRHLSQSSWNPVAGFGDVYSSDLAGPTSTPSAISHPDTGEVIPHAVQRSAATAGPDGSLDVPPDAMRWDPYTQQWAAVGDNAKATSVVTLNYTFSNWHHGQPTDINDVLYVLYFADEWGTVTGEDDVTQDSEYTSTTAVGLEDLVGIRQVDADTMEVYLDYWTFDVDELASSGVFWVSIPWEIFYATEQMVIDGKAEFSDTDALAHDVPWLSLLDAADTATIREYLVSFLDEGEAPPALEGMDSEYYADRYRAAISWIDEHGHAFVDNGPFMLKSYDDQAGTAVLEAFRDESYPYPVGIWSDFTEPKFPTVVGVNAPQMGAGEPYSFAAFTTNADTIRYFLSYETGGLVSTGEISASGDDFIGVPVEDTAEVDTCRLTLRVFAFSDTVIIPDVQKTSVEVVNCGVSLEERLEELGITGEMEFLRTTASVVDAATREGGVSVEEIIRIVDEAELGEAAVILLAVILEDSLSGDELFEYLRP